MVYYGREIICNQNHWYIYTMLCIQYVFCFIFLILLRSWAHVDSCAVGIFFAYETNWFDINFYGLLESIHITSMSFVSHKKKSLFAYCFSFSLQFTCRSIAQNDWYKNRKSQEDYFIALEQLVRYEAHKKCF